MLDSTKSLDVFAIVNPTKTIINPSNLDYITLHNTTFISSLGSVISSSLVVRPFCSLTESNEI